MPPRRRGGSGFRGVRVRPSGTYSASVRLGGGVRLGLGTFDTAQNGARAYDAAAWRLRRSRWDMNFTDVATPERAQELAPFPRLITDEDRAKTGGGSAVSAWPRWTRKPWHCGGDASSWDSRDDRFLDAYAQTSEEDITETESESENDE
nr:ethylene-responsive transcription factor ERF098-like [Aegilops tauschii subsp. strangulata]